jgi:hypothetical protein
MKVGCREDCSNFGQGSLMGLKLQAQVSNMMLLKHSWGAPTSHNHIPHSTQNGPIETISGQ